MVLPEIQRSLHTILISGRSDAAAAKAAFKKGMRFCYPYAMGCVVWEGCKTALQRLV